MPSAGPGTLGGLGDTRRGGLRDGGALLQLRYKLIDQCLDSRDPLDLEALQNKDYGKVKGAGDGARAC